MKLLELTRAKLHTHLINLFKADAMLAGDGAARTHTKLKNLRAELLRAFELA